jgi:hypothetical protein
MKITERQLRRLIKEESQKLLNEEPSDYYRDYRNGSISYEEYQQMVKDYESRTGGSGSRNSNYRPSSRKTSYVGSDANADQIAAVEAALSAKPNNFLTSVLGQLKNGRGLSGKQKSIVKSIIKKTDPSAAGIFETKKNKMKITKRQLRNIVREAVLPNPSVHAVRNPATIPGSIASVDWIKFHDDSYYDTNPPEWLNNPTEELNAFLDLIISSALKSVLNDLGLRELYQPAMNEIDYEGIFNGGKTLMSILRHVFPNTNQAMLGGALQQWAAENTSSGKVHSGQMP